MSLDIWIRALHGTSLITQRLANTVPSEIPYSATLLVLEIENHD